MGGSGFLASDRLSNTVAGMSREIIFHQKWEKEEISGVTWGYHLKTKGGDTT